MDNIQWSPSAKCDSCGESFLAQSAVVCNLTSAQLINGPYPQIHMSNNRITCINCNSTARLLDYTPEIVKNELQKMRSDFLEIRENELREFFKKMQSSHPQNFNQLLAISREISPSVSKIIGKFKDTLNWICLIGGTWAFFKELERTLM